jgi:hypothetical protein
MGTFIVSLHMPKTGGTTFAHFIPKIVRYHFLDYKDKPLADGYEKRKLDNCHTDYINMLRILKLFEVSPKEIVIVHGHFFVTKYITVFPDAKLVTWLREPVQRVISSYYEWQRWPDMDHSECRKMVEEKMSLEEYVCMEKTQNLCTRFLNKVSIREFSFVGITEKFDKSIQLFKSMFLPELKDVEYSRKNEGDKKPRVSKQTRQMIAEYNKDDIELYKESKSKFNELCKRFI